MDKKVNSGQTEREAFERFLRDKKFPVLPVWKDGKPFQNYALEVMFDAWQAGIMFARAAAPQGMTDDLRRRVQRALMAGHPNLAREFAEARAAASEQADEAAADARDTARYRWLVANCFDWAAPGDGDSFDHIELHFESDMLSRDDESVGRAIDAEIAKEPSNPPNKLPGEK